MGAQNFDDRLQRFQDNIYQTDKGQIRLAILKRDLAPWIAQGPYQVLDVGCGLGQMAGWWASQQHQVTACDISAKAIQQAQRLTAERENQWLAQSLKKTDQQSAQQINQQTLSHIHWLHGGVEALPDGQLFDWVLCHAVLEWVVDWQALLAQLLAHLKPDGRLSLMFHNAWGREMTQLVYGNYDYIDSGYQVKKTVKLNPHYPRAPDVVEQALKQLGRSVAYRSGVRVFSDLISEKNRSKVDFAPILEHELRISTQSPYWQLARYVHFIV